LIYLRHNINKTNIPVCSLSIVTCTSRRNSTIRFRRRHSWHRSRSYDQLALSYHRVRYRDLSRELMNRDHSREHAAPQTSLMIAR